MAGFRSHMKNRHCGGDTRLLSAHLASITDPVSKERRGLNSFRHNCLDGDDHAAVLISACGSMILSTSTRLGRVVDRVRILSERLEEISNRQNGNDIARERQAAIYDQLDKLTSRARLLQRCMVTFYLSLGAFVSTSVAIGVVAISSQL